MPDDGTSIDLALATEEDLLTELSTRYTSCLVIFCKPTKGERDSSRETMGTRWRGSIPAVLGLSEYGRRDIQRYVYGIEKSRD